MFDFLNPTLREAKRRAKEEYNRQLLQGKVNLEFQRAQEKAARKLHRMETAPARRRSFFRKLGTAALYVIVFVVVVSIFGR